MDGTRFPTQTVLAASEALGTAPVWCRRIGTGTSSRLATYAAAVSEVGGLFLVGWQGDRLDLGPLGGPSLHGIPGQAFVLKLSPSGSLLWHEGLSHAAGSLAPWAIAADGEGGCYLACPSARGGALLQLDRSGRQAWRRPLDELLPCAKERVALAVDHAGDLVLVACSAEPSALVLMKLTRRGAVVWERQYPCVAARQPSVAVDAMGAVLVSAYFHGSLTFGTRTLRAPECATVFFAKVSADGQCRWSVTFPAEGSSDLHAGMGPAGGVLLGGSQDGGTLAEGSRRVYLASFTPGGAPDWGRYYPGDAALLPGPVEVDVAVTDGGAVLAGVLSGGLDLGASRLRSAPDEEALFVARLDTRGVPLWSYCVPGARHLVGVRVLPAADERVFVLGSFTGALCLDDPPLENQAERFDLFVARFGPHREVS
jgi:hypothetical protein